MKILATLGLAALLAVSPAFAQQAGQGSVQPIAATPQPAFALAARGHGAHAMTVSTKSHKAKGAKKAHKKAGGKKPATHARGHKLSARKHAHHVH